MKIGFHAHALNQHVMATINIIGVLIINSVLLKSYVLKGTAFFWGHNLWLGEFVSLINVVEKSLSIAKVA